MNGIIHTVYVEEFKFVFRTYAIQIYPSVKTCAFHLFYSCVFFKAQIRNWHQNMQCKLIRHQHPKVNNKYEG